MGFLIVILGLLFLTPAWLLRRGRWYRRLAAICFTFAALIALSFGSYWIWFTHRVQPPEITETWFQGITYQCRVLQDPRPIVVHIVKIDLHAPGIAFTATAPHDASNLPLRAQTVSDFARATNAQVAINANFFFPFSAGHPLDYYPHTGDPVQVNGFAATGGIIYQSSRQYVYTLFIDRKNKPTFDDPPEGPFIAISGNKMLVRDGRAIGIHDDLQDQHARTAIGLDRDSRTLFLVVVEGKQPGYSLGVSQPELAAFLVDQGAHNAINLDGGGSSTLVRQVHTDWKLINSTSNFKMPWWERPVANHLGIRAQPAK